jgi:hypothetical protein
MLIMINKQELLDIILMSRREEYVFRKLQRKATKNLLVLTVVR